MKKYKIIDKKSTYIEKGVILGNNVVIGPNVVIRGKTKIGENTIVDSNSIITDSIIGENNYIVASVIEKNNNIGSSNKIGPFTHLREDNKIGNYNEIGSYVEIKGSLIKDSNNIKHLSYVGNAIIGNGVNVGAGTVFANYNSKKMIKESTSIEDDVSIGSNSTLVAPVKIARNTMVGAGTIVYHEIDKDSLYFQRPKEIYKKDYYKEEENK